MKKYVAEPSQTQEVRNLNELQGVRLSLFYKFKFRFNKWCGFLW